MGKTAWSKFWTRLFLVYGIWKILYVIKLDTLFIRMQKQVFLRERKFFYLSIFANELTNNC